MIAPTCRNPECGQKDIPKPFFEPPEVPSAFAVDASTIQWFCGECGSECESVEADEAEFADRNPYSVPPEGV